MSQRTIICYQCGAVVQTASPLCRGGTMMPVPGICPTCEEAEKPEAACERCVQGYLCPLEEANKEIARLKGIIAEIVTITNAGLEKLKTL